MPSPIDLSQVAARSAPQQKGLFGQGRGGPRRGGGRGTGTRLDDYARTALRISAVIAVLLLGYLLAGLYSGYWTQQGFHALSHQARAQQLQNIGLVFQVLQFSCLILVLSLLVIAMRDENLGYVLAGFGLAYYLGIPALTSQIYDWRGLKPSSVTQLLMTDFQSLARLFFVPGVLWILGDLVRRIRRVIDSAAIQQANMKYGADAAHQQPAKQRFLGSPGKRPKRQRRRTFLTPKERRRTFLTPKERRWRSYMALATAAFVVVPVLMWLNIGLLRTGVWGIVQGMEITVARFSFGEPTRISLAQSGILTWVLLGTLCLVLITQTLKLIEFWCFKYRL